MVIATLPHRTGVEPGMTGRRLDNGAKQRLDLVLDGLSVGADRLEPAAIDHHPHDAKARDREDPGRATI